MLFRFCCLHHPPRYLGKRRAAESAIDRVSIDKVTDQTPREDEAEDEVEVIAVSDDDAPITTLNKAKRQPVDTRYIYRPVASHESATPTPPKSNDDGASHSSGTPIDLSPEVTAKSAAELTPKQPATEVAEPVQAGTPIHLSPEVTAKPAAELTPKQAASTAPHAAEPVAEKAAEPVAEKTTELAASMPDTDDPDLAALLAQAANAALAMQSVQALVTRRAETVKAKELENKHAAALAELKDTIAKLERTVEDLTIRDSEAAGSVTVRELDFRVRTKALDTPAVEMSFAERQHEHFTALIGKSREEATDHEAKCEALNRKIKRITSMIATFDADKAKLGIETARSLAADVVDDAESEDLQHTINTLEDGLRSNENLCSILAKSEADLAIESKLAAGASARALEAEKQAEDALALCTSLETTLRTLEEQQKLAEFNLKAAEVARDNVATELREASAALKAKREELELALQVAPPVPTTQSAAQVPTDGPTDRPTDGPTDGSSALPPLPVISALRTDAVYSPINSGPNSPVRPQFPHFALSFAALRVSAGI